MRIAAMRSLSGESRVKSRKLRVRGIKIARETIAREVKRRAERRKFRGLAMLKMRRKSMAKVTMAEVVISSALSYPILPERIERAIILIATVRPVGTENWRMFLVN